MSKEILCIQSTVKKVLLLITAAWEKIERRLVRQIYDFLTSSIYSVLLLGMMI